MYTVAGLLNEYKDAKGFIVGNNNSSRPLYYSKGTITIPANNGDITPRAIGVLIATY